MTLQAGICGGGFDHRTIGAKISAQHEGAALTGEGLIQREDYFVIKDFSPRAVFPDGFPGDG